MTKKQKYRLELQKKNCTTKELHYRLDERGRLWIDRVTDSLVVRTIFFKSGRLFYKAVGKVYNDGDILKKHYEVFA